MKIRKKTLLTVSFIAIMGFLLRLDFLDRNKFSPEYISEELRTELYVHKTSEQQEKAFERNFGNPNYSFPKEKILEIKLFNNYPVISRITVKNVDGKNKAKLISFFNNPSNFSFGETTWNVMESEYILRFFDKKQNEIGKIWLCLEGCGMTKSIPFSPNMKYGGLSKSGKVRLKKILDKILRG